MVVCLALRTGRSFFDQIKLEGHFLVELPRSLKFVFFVLFDLFEHRRHRQNYITRLKDRVGLLRFRGVTKDLSDRFVAEFNDWIFLLLTFFLVTCTDKYDAIRLVVEDFDQLLLLLLY